MYVKITWFSYILIFSTSPIEIPSEIRRNVSTTDGVLNVTATIIDLTSVTNLLVRPERLVPLNSTGVYVFGVFQFGQLQGAVIVIGTVKRFCLFFVLLIVIIILIDYYVPNTAKVHRFRSFVSGGRTTQL